jgi:probable rRNA maturation factor
MDASSINLTFGGIVVPNEAYDAIGHMLEALMSISGLDLPAGDIGVQFVDDTQIRALNKDYSGKDEVTDVLSFSYIEDGAEPIEGVIGEMAVSLDTARVQAKKAKTDLVTELALLVLHGILHVCGRDHADKVTMAELDELQEQIMTAAGLTYRNFGWVL